MKENVINIEHYHTPKEFNKGNRLKSITFIFFTKEIWLVKVPPINNHKS